MSERVACKVEISNGLVMSEVDFTLLGNGAIKAVPTFNGMLTVPGFWIRTSNQGPDALWIKQDERVMYKKDQAGNRTDEISGRIATWELDSTRAMNTLIDAVDELVRKTEVYNQFRKTAGTVTTGKKGASSNRKKM